MERVDRKLRVRGTGGPNRGQDCRSFQCDRCIYAGDRTLDLRERDLRLPALPGATPSG